MKTQSIPLVNLNRMFETYRPDFMEALERIALESSFIGGSAVKNFLDRFAAWVGNGLGAVGCGNGTDAITLAVKAMGLPPGSVALIPAMTFVATAEGILNAGMKPALVDVEPETGLMNPHLIEEALQGQPRLIVPVHLYGQMAGMDLIRSLADKAGCLVLEDAAQAHGATYQEHGPAYWGHAASFSFYPGKNLGAFGDGGAVVSPDLKLLERIAKLGNHGGLKKYTHEIVGTCSRLDGLQAALLTVKLKYIDEWTEKRRSIAGFYREALGDIEAVKLPLQKPQSRHVYHLFVLEVPDRDDLVTYLHQHGIEAAIHYPQAIHQLPAFKEYPFARQSFPVAERMAKHSLSLPLCPMMTQSEALFVADTVRNFFKR
jgi:dTDP-4-amino-4,6-dideoxygalactose transaminase